MSWFTRALYIVIALFLSHAVMAQDKKSDAEAKLNVRGIVYDNQELQPLQGAMVKLFTERDSLLIGAQTQKNGQYLLPNVPAGKYTLKVTFMGYKEQSFQLTLRKKSGNFKVNDIFLREDATVMKEAVVEGQMSEMTVSDDTIAYNADAFKMEEDAVVEDLIKKLPGLVEDENGGYTWNGKKISQILVDGKEFFGNNMGLSLKNLPANIIDKIKAYDRKSDHARITGVDDGEEKTVLDFSIKKNKKKGWFSTLDGGYGTKSRYSGRAMVNRFIGDQKISFVGNTNNSEGDGMTDRQSFGMTMNIENPKKLELNGGINGNFSQGSSERTTSSQSFVNQKAAYSNSHSSSGNNNRNLSFNYKIEWTPDTMTNVLFRPTISYGNSDSHSQSESASFKSNPYDQEGITNPLSQIDEIAKQIGVNHRHNMSQSESKNFSASGSLQVNRRLKKQGRNVSLDVDGGWGNSDSYSESFNMTDYYLLKAKTGDDSIYHKTQYNDSGSKNRHISARATYIEPLWQKVYLQLSYQYSYRYTDHDRTVSSIFDPKNAQLGLNFDNFHAYRNQSTLDTAQCNYTTNIYQNHNINLQLRFNYTKFQLTVGANIQPQRNAVDYNKGGKHYDIARTVVNASPTVNFRWKFSRQEQFNLRYHGSTGQPSITDLIPDTLSNADPLNIRLGNPDLKPSFTQSLNADYHKSIPDLQRSFSTNVQFNTTKNSTSSRTEYNDDTGGRITRPANVNGNWSGSASVNFNTAFKGNKRFRFNTDTQGSLTNSVGYVYRSKLKETVTNKTKGLNARESIRFSFRNDWLEVNADGGFQYHHTRSTNTSASNLDTYRFNYGMSTTMKLPWNMTFSTNIGEHSRRGYSDAAMNTNELIWGFSISQRFLPKKNLTISLKAVDVLNQRQEVYRNISTTSRTDTETRNIHSYYMLTCNYRFAQFGGRSHRSQNSKDNANSSNRNNRGYQRNGNNRSSWGGGGRSSGGGRGRF